MPKGTLGNWGNKAVDRHENTRPGKKLDIFRPNGRYFDVFSVKIYEIFDLSAFLHSGRASIKTEAFL